MSDEPEFTDIVRNGPFVSSTQAHDAIMALAREHGLHFTHNPGGGEFYTDGWRCQISAGMDDVDDYKKLRDAIRARAPH